MKSEFQLVRRAVALFAITVVLITTGCVKTAPMVAPKFQVAVSDSKRIHEAIRGALVQRKWVILKNEPNAIEAKYTRGNKHVAHIRVSHVGNQVTISHVDSHEMRYSHGAAGPIIHKWYNTWVTNLERDIQVAVGAVQ
jgi:hypothetical protein